MGFGLILLQMVLTRLNCSGRNKIFYIQNCLTTSTRKNRRQQIQNFGSFDSFIISFFEAKSYSINIICVFYLLNFNLLWF